MRSTNLLEGEKFDSLRWWWTFRNRRAVEQMKLTMSTAMLNREDERRRSIRGWVAEILFLPPQNVDPGPMYSGTLIPTNPTPGLENKGRKEREQLTPMTTTLT